jgi:hypothetical protein
MKHFFLVFIALVLANVGFSQGSNPVKSTDGTDSKYLLKTNIPYWFTTTPNLGFEAGLSPKLSLDLGVNYNPWNLSGEKTFKHFLVQPELRYWTKERFNGHFFGVHFHYANYNIGGIDVPLFHFPNYRYEGNLFGAGVSYGYMLRIAGRWNLEFTAGLGYAHLDYSVYPVRREPTSDLGYHPRNYFTPTKVGINLIYVIK